MDKRFNSIAEVREANRRAGSYFFSADTMRFFGSKVESGLYGGRYFITSEKAGFSSDLRKFTIREAQAGGEVRTVLEFNGFRDLESAREKAKELAREER